MFRTKILWIFSFFIIHSECIELKRLSALSTTTTSEAMSTTSTMTITTTTTTTTSTTTTPSPPPSSSRSPSSQMTTSTPSTTTEMLSSSTPSNTIDFSVSQILVFNEKTQIFELVPNISLNAITGDLDRVKEDKNENLIEPNSNCLNCENGMPNMNSSSCDCQSLKNKDNSTEQFETKIDKPLDTKVEDERKTPITIKPEIITPKPRIETRVHQPASPKRRIKVIKPSRKRITINKPEIQVTKIEDVESDYNLNKEDIKPSKLPETENEEQAEPENFKMETITTKPPEEIKPQRNRAEDFKPQRTRINKNDQLPPRRRTQYFDAMRTRNNNEHTTSTPTTIMTTITTTTSTTRKPKTRSRISSTNKVKQDRKKITSINSNTIQKPKQQQQPQQCQYVACISPCYIFRTSLDECPECSCPEFNRYDKIKFFATSSFEPSFNNNRFINSTVFG